MTRASGDSSPYTTAQRLQALRDGGLTNTDILQLVKTEGREAVLQMGEDELKRGKKQLS